MIAVLPSGKVRSRLMIVGYGSKTIVLKEMVFRVEVPGVGSGRIPAALSCMQREWERVTKGRLLGFGVGFVALIVLILLSEQGFVILLDHANLLFHEAGHPIIGLFSSRLEPYGGTLGQLVFPVVLAIGCWRKGQAIGVAAGGLWFFENFFNIARYVADARAMQLPLVGGGQHDWNTILGRWQLLSFDTWIAAVLAAIGWLGFAAVVTWLLWRAWQDRLRQTEAHKQQRREAFCSAPFESQ